MRHFSLSVLLLTNTLYATAQSVELDKMNVTADRMALSSDKTLAAVAIITQEEIEKSQARDLTTLLATHAGISTFTRGGYGSVSSLFMRGSPSNQTLILIDGVRVGSATTGTPTLNGISLSQIDRIEIVRGPRSSLYGADAIGGVIQIFTRRSANTTQADANLAIGSNKTHDLNASLAGGTETIQFTLGAGIFDTQGISAIKDNNPDKDGHTQRSFNAGVTYNPTETISLQLNVINNQGTTEYDDAYDTTGRYEADFVNQIAQASLSYSPNDTWESTLSISHHRDNYDDLVYGETNTRRKQLIWQNELTIQPDQGLSFGFDAYRDEVSGDVDYDKDSRDNKAVFAHYHGEIADYIISGGLRYDDNEEYGDHTTGNLSLGYRILGQTLVYGAYGSGFKAPTFNDLYYPGFSNPDLDPEQARNYEFGLKGDQPWGDWSVNYFDNRITDLIQYNPATMQPENIAKAHIRGLETTLSANLMNWLIGVHVTLLNPRDEDTGDILPHRPQRTFRLDTDRKFGQNAVGLTFTAESSRESIDYSSYPSRTVTLGGYGLVDLRYSRELVPEWSLKAQIKNLFDKEYETVYSYNNLGRELFVSIHYRYPGS